MSEDTQFASKCNSEYTKKPTTNVSPQIIYTSPPPSPQESTTNVSSHPPKTKFSLPLLLKCKLLLIFPPLLRFKINKQNTISNATSINKMFHIRVSIETKLPKYSLTSVIKFQQTEIAVKRIYIAN
jgi:hypothetical protein